MGRCFLREGLGSAEVPVVPGEEEEGRLSCHGPETDPDPWGTTGLSSAAARGVFALIPAAAGCTAAQGRVCISHISRGAHVCS